MQSKKVFGIISLVFGGAVGVWVITRLTSLHGKLCSWSPPFSEYEVITLVGAGVAVLLIIAGLISLTMKGEQFKVKISKGFKITLAIILGFVILICAILILYPKYGPFIYKIF